MPTGMFTKKIQRQPSPVTRAPPITGPAAMAMPVIAPKTPKATPLCGPFKVYRASEVANMMAPPTPWPARAIDRKEDPGRGAHSNDPSVKIGDSDDEEQTTAVPVGEDRRGRAERRGPERRRRAPTAVLNPACSPPWIAGWAIVTIVTSSSSMNIPVQTAIRVHHFLSISSSVSRRLSRTPFIMLRDLTFKNPRSRRIVPDLDSSYADSRGSIAA